MHSKDTKQNETEAKHSEDKYIPCAPATPERPLAVKACWKEAAVVKSAADPTAVDIDDAVVGMQLVESCDCC